MISLRKLLAFLSFVALLLAAMTPVSAVLLWAALAPFLLIVGAAHIVWAERLPKRRAIPVLSCLQVIDSRPPPIAHPLI
jgi:hypothetical protein